MENYEEWDMAIPALPDRSRFYHLEPVGIGTPYVESLTSYVIRLATTHHLNPKTLVMQEIFPLLGKLNLHRKNPHLHATWYRDAITLNGASSYTEDWIKALERLTLYDNLSALTMVTWRNAIHYKGLLRETQAWCPVCYEEWRKSNSDIYNPLIWALRSTTVCLHHSIYLQTQCPYKDCMRSLSFLSLWSRLGYCSHCMRWLGTDSQSSMSKGCDISQNEDVEYQYWKAENIGELVSIAPSVSVPPDKEKLALFLTQYSKQFADDSLVLMARQLKMSYNTLLSWQKKISIPHLELLLQLSYGLQMSIGRIFTEDVKNLLIDVNIKPLIRDQHKSRSREDLRLSLEAFLRVEPPLSVREITSILGYRSEGHLYQDFSELCSLLTARHQLWYKAEPIDDNKRRFLLGDSTDKPRSREDLRLFLEAFFTVEPPLSVQEITSILGYRSRSHLYQNFSELCGLLTTRHQQWYKPEAVDDNKRRPNLSKEDMRKKLEAVLASNEDPLPSIRQIGLSFGYQDEEIFYRHFPDLCREVIEKRRQQFRSNPIKQALEEILLSNVYPPPSMSEVAKKLGYPYSYIYNRFPALCKAITKQHDQLFDIEALRTVLETTLSDDVIPPPSVRDLAKRCGFGEARLRRHLPDLCAKVTQKYRDYKKTLAATRIEGIYEDVKNTILYLQTQGCYPSLPKVRGLLVDKKYWIKDVNDAWRRVMLELNINKHRN